MTRPSNLRWILLVAANVAFWCVLSLQQSQGANYGTTASGGPSPSQQRAEIIAELKEIRESGLVKDSILARQIELLYNAYLGGQVDTSLIAQQIKMETELSKMYANFRVNINGKQISDNEVEGILRNSTSSSDLKAAWEESKKIGPVVAADIIKLVKHRNTIAQKIGF